MGVVDVLAGVGTGVSAGGLVGTVVVVAALLLAGVGTGVAARTGIDTGAGLVPGIGEAAGFTAEAVGDGWTGRGTGVVDTTVVGCNTCGGGTGVSTGGGSELGLGI